MGLYDWFWVEKQKKNRRKEQKNKDKEEKTVKGYLVYTKREKKEQGHEQMELSGKEKFQKK